MIKLIAGAAICIAFVAAVRQAYYMRALRLEIKDQRARTKTACRGLEKMQGENKRLRAALDKALREKAMAFRSLSEMVCEVALIPTERCKTKMERRLMKILHFRRLWS